jgi:two-component system phosphate regulon sensor histidine kinase PhoR
MRLTIQWKFLAASLLLVTISLGIAGFLVMGGMTEMKAPWTWLGGLLLLSWLIASGLALILSYPFIRLLTRPIRETMSVAHEWAKGRMDRRATIRSQDELADLGRVLNQMASDLEARMTEITEDRARLTAILSSMVEGVLVLDYRGTILMVNAALERMFRLKEQEAIGRSYLEVLRHHPVIALIKTVLDTRTNQSHEVAIQIPQEAHFYVQASVAPDCRDQEVCAVLVFHDITELKRLERVRKDFVANVSHELKTPLTSIKGYIEALIDGAKDDPQRCSAFLAVIQKHTDNLNATLSDLLQLSAIESGQYRWKREAVSVPDLIEKAAGLVRSTVEKKRQSLSLICSENLPDLYGDPDKLTEVLINLLDNAVKYTPEGGQVTVEAVAAGNAVEISVSDTGIGIPPKDIPRIFERFYRVDRARSRELGGTGLGLSIVKHIVEAHRGTVRVQSEPGKGSRFTLLLPTA